MSGENFGLEYIIDYVLAILLILSYFLGYRFFVKKEMMSGISGNLKYFYFICIFISFIMGFSLFIDNIIIKMEHADRELLNGWHTLLTGALLWVPFLQLGKNYPNYKIFTLLPLSITLAGVIVLFIEYIKNQEIWKIIFSSFLVFQTFIMDICIWFFCYYMKQIN